VLENRSRNMAKITAVQHMLALKPPEEFLEITYESHPTVSQPAAREGRAHEGINMAERSQSERVARQKRETKGLTGLGS
jgi:hypothetical protein